MDGKENGEENLIRAKLENMQRDQKEREERKISE